VICKALREHFNFSFWSILEGGGVKSERARINFKGVDFDGGGGVKKTPSQIRDGV
jgi:hypothetical protein